MEPLDTKDLQRFSWDKMSPGIDQKIKVKKRKRFLKRFINIGIVGLVVFIGMYLIQFDSLNIISDSSASLTKETIQNQSEVASSTQVLDMTSSSIQKIKQIEKELNLSNKQIALEDEKAKGISSITKKEERKNYYTNLMVDKDYAAPASIQEQNVIVSSSETNRETFGASFTKSVNTALKSETLTKELPNKNLVAVSQLPIYMPLVTMNLDRLIDSSLMLITLMPEDSISYASNAIELAVNFNSLTYHPHNPLIGTGVNLGYTVDAGKSSYFGFEFAFQRLRYRFDYSGFSTTETFGVTEVLLDTLNNEEVIVWSEITESNSREIRNYNTHDIYSIPVYYGYRFKQSDLQFSVEAGVNISLIKFSSGIVNSPSNSNAIIELENSNLYAKNIGTSVLLRAKLVYPVGNNIDIFSRLGSNIMLKNWYTNNNNTLKPQIINWDLGVRKSF